MTSELRKHQRFSSQLNARLILTDGSGYECLIQDYSHSGMKILWTHGDIPEQPGPMVLEIQLSSPVRTDVDLVYQESDNIGVRIHEADGQLFLNMQEFNQNNRGSTGLPPVQRERFRNIFAVEANSMIETLPVNWLPSFIDSTHEKVDYARNTTEQQLWMLTQHKFC